MIHNAFLNPFDTTVYHFINGFAGKNHVIDSIAIFFAKDAIEIYAVLFVLAWFVLPKRDIKNRHALVMAGLSGILALLINVIISHIWFRPRPFLTIPHHTELVAHSADASFPSDHTSGSFGFAAGSWGRQQKWISWLFTIIAVLVMIARVFVGVHYPTDVIGGMIVGIIASQIMWRFSKLIFPISNAIAKLFRFGLLDKAGSKSQIQKMSRIGVIRIVAASGARRKHRTQESRYFNEGLSRQQVNLLIWDGSFCVQNRTVLACQACYPM